MHRRGFTLIEVLVTIGIIGVLAAILLPAVGAAREAGRRTQCLANLRQLGIATENYHDTHGCYPPGRWPSFDPRNRGNNYPCTSAYTDKSVFVLLLPFMEQQPLYDTVNQQLAGYAGENHTVHASILPFFRCPSDAGDAAREVSIVRFPLPVTQPQQATYLVARTSYIANFGTLNVLGMPALGGNCQPYPAAAAQLDGIFHDRFPIRHRDIVDGLSKTLFFAERASLALDDDPDPLSTDSELGWWFQGNMGDTLGTAACPPNAKGGSSVRRGMT